MILQIGLVMSQSIYACTVILHLFYHQITCRLQLFYCLLIDFTIILQWVRRVAGRGPGQAGRGLRLLYSDFTNLQIVLVILELVSIHMYFTVVLMFAN